jgi:hypothetical protein
MLFMAVRKQAIRSDVKSGLDREAVFTGEGGGAGLKYGE